MTRATCCSIVLAAFAGATTLQAEEVKWDDLCDQATMRAVTIKTTRGITVTGICDVNTEYSITLRTKRGLRSVARDDIKTARLANRQKTHCLATVRGTALKSYGYGVLLLLTPYFVASPVLIAGTPVILGGGAPFCAVHDLVNRFAGSHKITII